MLPVWSNNSSRLAVSKKLQFFNGEEFIERTAHHERRVKVFMKHYTSFPTDTTTEFIREPHSLYNVRMRRHDRESDISFFK